VPSSLSALVFAAIASTWVLACGAPDRADPAAPSRPREARPLVVFLHGMTEPGLAGEGADDRIRRRFEEAGFELAAPTGREGLCDWSDEVKRARCWPSDERSLGAAREIAGEWRQTLAPSRPIVVVGFSNGGAFATLLALHGLVRACGFATMHGFPAGTLHASAATKAPLLLIAGRGAPWESGQLATTTRQLTALGWPHDARTHDGAHAISDADLDATIAFAHKAVDGCRGEGGSR
jgi:predicted esterase